MPAWQVNSSSSNGESENKNKFWLSSGTKRKHGKESGNKGKEQRNNGHFAEEERKREEQIYAKYLKTRTFRKFQDLLAQVKLKDLSNQMRNLENHMNTLSMKLLNHILSFGQQHIGVGKMRRSSPVFEHCWSVEKIGSLQEGDCVVVQLPSQNDPPMTPILPEGAVFASRIEVAVGVPAISACKLSSVTEEALQTDRSRFTSLDLVEIA